MTTARRGEPTPPIEIESTGAEGGDRVSVRFPPVAVVDDTLVERLRGACGDVTTDHDSRVEAGRDWWPITMTWARRGEIPALPAVVARPASTDEVAAVLRLCNEAQVPVTTAAGRSGVCGASVPVFGGVVLDVTAMHGVMELDDASLLLRVRAGTFGDVLEDELRQDHGVTVGHWPQSIALSTVGGWLACRSAGQYSTRYGKIEDMVIGLTAVLADGSVYETAGRAPRAAVGPELARLFVGSEGTLGVITDAWLRVHPVPPAERRAAYGFATFADGLDACRRILRRGATPAVLRLYDERESRRYSEGTNVLLVLDEGDPAVIDGVMAVVRDECETTASAVLDEALLDLWLDHRNDTSGLQQAIRNDVVVDTTEVAAPWAVLPAIYREGVEALKAVDGMWVASAHQSHSYSDGACIYFTWAGQPAGDGEGNGDRFYAQAWAAITSVVRANGGAISHHHGIGLNRGALLVEALGSELHVLRRVKDALDPNGILNPGKLGLDSPFGSPPWP